MFFAKLKGKFFSKSDHTENQKTGIKKWSFQSTEKTETSRI